MISTANDISGAILGILGAGGKLGKFHFMTGINDGNFIIQDLVELVLVELLVIEYLYLLSKVKGLEDLEVGKIQKYL